MKRLNNRRLLICSGAMLLMWSSAGFAVDGPREVEQRTEYRGKVRSTEPLIHAVSDASDSGLIAHWSFDGGSVQDNSGNGHGGFLNGAVPAPGMSAGALQFDGIDDFVLVGHSSQLQPVGAITVAAWVKPTGFYAGLCQGNEIICKGTDATPGSYVLLYTDQDDQNCDVLSPSMERFAFYIADTLGIWDPGARSTTVVESGRWHHVVGTYDGAVMRLYVNGVQEDTLAVVKGMGSNSYDLRIGTHPSGAYPYWLNGAIDEVRLYGRALSSGEVLDLYADGLQHIATNPTTLDFTAQYNGLLPDSQTFTLINTGSGTLDWTVTFLPPGADWLSVAPPGGTGAGLPITVSITRTNLSPVVHHASVEVSSTNADNSPQSVAIAYTLECPIARTGDVNTNGAITAADVIYLVGYVFKSGTEPLPCPASGDANCNGVINVQDILVLVIHVFKSGPPPCDACPLIPGTWTCP